MLKFVETWRDAIRGMDIVLLEFGVGIEFMEEEYLVGFLTRHSKASLVSECGKEELQTATAPTGRQTMMFANSVKRSEQPTNRLETFGLVTIISLTAMSGSNSMKKRRRTEDVRADVLLTEMLGVTSLIDHHQHGGMRQLYLKRFVRDLDTAALLILLILLHERHQVVMKGRHLADVVLGVALVLAVVVSSHRRSEMRGDQLGNSETDQCRGLCCVDNFLERCCQSVVCSRLDDIGGDLFTVDLEDWTGISAGIVL
ncbi:unnamed protein product [Mesocestoides corti]|uniref:Uncharacterized protein n=1 Tax=Mesocestoides corti TaxID=53468 RepID=A0A0R3UCW6_MESCO|nr:unnamed protein product [Mesocestoides corti]